MSLQTNTTKLNELKTKVNSLPDQNPPVSLQERTVVSTTVQQEVLPDEGYDGFSKIIVNAIPNGEVNTLSLGEVRYNIEKSEIKTPNWKVACYIVSGLIMLLAVIIKFSLCRCPSCTRYINLMNIFTTHCPYCGKSLDKSK